MKTSYILRVIIISFALFFVLPKVLLLHNNYQVPYDDFTTYKLTIALAFATFILFQMGWLICESFHISWISIKNKIPIFHYVYMGQVSLVFYFFLRSFINFLLIKVSIPYFPIGYWDIALIICLLLFFKKKDFDKSIYKFSNRSFSKIYFPFLLFLIILFILVSAELPRLTPLSTDPNIHSFLAFQTDRFNTSLYEFYDYGVQTLTYPSGFGILNFIWMEISQLNAIDIVTIQPQLQLIISIFIIAEVMVLNLNKLSLFKQIALVSILIYLYFNLWPYGYQITKYHLEGTPRTSLMPSVAFLVSYVIYFNKNKQNIRFNEYLKKSLPNFLNLFFVIIINPINSIYLLSLTILNELMVLKKKVFYTGILIVITLTISFLDPFFVNNLINTSANEQNLNLISKNNKIESSVESLLDSIVQYSTQIYGNFKGVFIFEGLVSQDVLIYLIIGLILILFIFSFLIQSKSKLGYVVIKILLQLFLAFMIFNIVKLIINILIQNKTFLSGYLLDPYFDFSTFQFLYMWLLFAIALSILISWKHKLFTLTLLIALLYLPLINKSHQKFQPRRNYPGSIGSVTANDLIVLKKIENLYTKQTINKSYAEYIKSPKIMILAGAVQMGNEKWLFPSNAETILPLNNVFPIAFFYSISSADYSYNNYKLHVMKGLDKNWLKERNISYIFIPENDQIDNENLASDINKLDKVIQEGNSRLLKL